MNPKNIQILSYHFFRQTRLLTHPPTSVILSACPGRPGAAGLPEPRQVRKEAAIRRRSWVPPIPCPDLDSFSLDGFHHL